MHYNTTRKNRTKRVTFRSDGSTVLDPTYSYWTGA
jgi:hypothetical protein